MYKFVAAPTKDLGVPIHVTDICSISDHISEAFSDLIPQWKHNGFWLFDTPEAAREAAQEIEADLSEATLFYYETLEFEFHEKTRAWRPVAPEQAFKTAVVEPRGGKLVGFDVATFSAAWGAECSPLSCNGLALRTRVNQHCLFETLAMAKTALESGLFDDSEPGPYRIVAVYRIDP